MFYVVSYAFFKSCNLLYFIIHYLLIYIPLPILFDFIFERTFHSFLPLHLHNTTSNLNTHTHITHTITLKNVTVYGRRVVIQWIYELTGSIDTPFRQLTFIVTHSEYFFLVKWEETLVYTWNYPIMFILIKCPFYVSLGILMQLINLFHYVLLHQCQKKLIYSESSREARLCNGNRNSKSGNLPTQGFISCFF